MKKSLFILTSLIIFSQSVFAGPNLDFFNLRIFNNDVRDVKALLNSQVRYANRTDFDKFIATYDKNYINGDGFSLEKYSNLVKDVWGSYDKITYGIKIKEVYVEDGVATVDLIETSHANIPGTANMDGVLRSEAQSIYHLKKIAGKWKVTSDEVLKETTSMLYGEAKGLDVKLTAPDEIKAGTEYTASLEFIPPEETIAIASIAKDKVEYPQQPTKEVYRKLPEDNILERLFISNKDNVNEYVIASIGLTKADLENLSIKLSLTGFGYKIVRVNVVPQIEEVTNDKTK